MELITVSIADAARALSVGRTTTYELINSGKLRAVKLGRRTLITVDSLKSLIADAEVVGDLSWEMAA